MSDHPLSSALQETFACLSPRESCDHPALNCPPEHLQEVVTHLRDQEGFSLLCDVSGIDWDKESPRFGVIYHFYQPVTHAYLRLVTWCPDNEDPKVPSLVHLYPAANWHERETYDMFGIQFEGHPDLRRILMWDEYPYFPLRKEFPLAGHETELPDEEVAEETQAKVKAAPMMGGPFVSAGSGPMSGREPRAEDESWTENSEKPSSDTSHG